jgi:hypothetical protein
MYLVYAEEGSLLGRDRHRVVVHKASCRVQRKNSAAALLVGMLEGGSTESMSGAELVHAVRDVESAFTSLRLGFNIVHEPVAEHLWSSRARWVHSPNNAYSPAFRPDMHSSL